MDLDEDQEPDSPSQAILAERYERMVVLDAAFELIKDIRDEKGIVRHILDQALDDARVAVNSLIGCDPTKAEEIRALQWKVTRFDNLCRYVFNILQAGEIAREDLTIDQADRLEKLQRALNGEDEQLRD